MANLALDLNKFKRDFWNVKADGEILNVKMPKKSTYEKIQSVMGMDTGAIDIGDAVDTLGELCAEILSNNMAGKTFKPEEISGSYSVEGMSEIVQQYMEFVIGSSNDPN